MEILSQDEIDSLLSIIDDYYILTESELEEVMEKKLPKSKIDAGLKRLVIAISSDLGRFHGLSESQIKVFMTVNWLSLGEPFELNHNKQELICKIADITRFSLKNVMRVLTAKKLVHRDRRGVYSSLHIFEDIDQIRYPAVTIKYDKFTNYTKRYYSITESYGNN